MRWWLLTICAAVSVAALVGCSAGQPAQGGKVKAPSLYDYDGGLKEAVGVLAYRDLEGGFWAVAETSDASQVDSVSNVVVVIAADAESEELLATLDGRYVSVVGAYDDGPSIFMAGPMLQMESIATVPAPGE